MFEAALEAGADDVVSNQDTHEIYAAQDHFGSVAKAVEAKFGEPRKASLVWRPQNTVAVDDEQGEKVLRLIEGLNDNDDVQNVYANFEVSDALVSRMSRVDCVCTRICVLRPLRQPNKAMVTELDRVEAVRQILIQLYTLVDRGMLKKHIARIEREAIFFLYEHHDLRKWDETRRIQQLRANVGNNCGPH